MRWNLLLSLLLLVKLSTHAFEAGAATITVGYNPDTGCNIHLQGDITAGDAERLFSALDEALSTRDEMPSVFSRIVCLDSPGGSLIEAIQIAEEIWFNSRALTYIPADAVCHSACALIFMSGSYMAGVGQGILVYSRSMHPDASLAFHRPSIRLPTRNMQVEELSEIFDLGIETMRRLGYLTGRSMRRERFLNPYLLESIYSTDSTELFFVDSVERAFLSHIGISETADFDESIYRSFTLENTSRPDLLAICNQVMLRHAMGAGWLTSDVVQFILRNGVGGRVDLPGVSLPDWQYFPGTSEREFIERMIITFERNRPNILAGLEIFYEYFFPPEINGYACAIHASRRVAYIISYDPRYFPYEELRSEDLENLQIVVVPLPGWLRASNDGSLTGLVRTLFDGPNVYLNCWLTSPTARVTNVTEYANLRRTPDFSAQVIREVPLGEPVRATRADNITVIGQERDRQSCISACQAFGRNAEDRAARDRAQQCIQDNMIWHEVTDATGNRGWVSRKFLEESE
jgi:hypothetical protein